MNEWGDMCMKTGQGVGTGVCMREWDGNGGIRA